ncbi:MAG: DUF2442 domain-containing protein [Deltaproteobacteria bacterium]|nr:MAG: DUF2442 domain-containing protein [Deltaproteobacteria bacterium]
MHFVRDVEYLAEYKLKLVFEDSVAKIADLEPYLDGEVFEPLKDADYFRKVSLNPDIDTVVWPNEADFSPDFLYEIGKDSEYPISDIDFGNRKAQAA